MNNLHTIATLHEIAANWYVRRQDHSWTAADEAALHTWLNADQVHRQAYAQLDATWEEFSGVARPRIASDNTQTTTAAISQTVTGGWLSGILQSVRIAPALLATTVLMVGGWFIYDNTPRYETRLSTTHAGVQTLDLPDGSHIALNIDSQLTVRYYPRKREITLAQGEAYFQVAPDTGKPFTVTTAHSTVRVLGTTFNVQTTPASLDVKVMQGKVEVKTDRHPREQILLTANQRVNIDIASDRHTLLSVKGDAVGDWRSGQLVWSSTPLTYVLQDLSRYLGHDIALKDTRLAKLPVTGFAATGKPDQFLAALPDLLPVKVTRLADQSFLVSAR